MSDTNPAIDPNILFEHRAWVSRLAERLLGDPHDAEDVVQRTWLVALSHPPREASALRAWLARVVRTTATDVGQRRRREIAFADPLAHAGTAGEAVHQEPATGDLVAIAEQHRCLVDRVLALDEPYRTTILARFFDEQTPSEIAAATGVPSSTVRVRLRRGLERLRESCQRDDPERWRGALGVLALPLVPGSKPVASVAVIAWNKLLVTAVACIMLATTVWMFSGSVPAVNNLGQGATGNVHVAESPTEAAKRGEQRTELAATPALALAEGAGTCIVHATWSDGSPAVGVGVHCISWGQPHAHSFLVDRRTDARGDAVFEDLPVGSTRFIIDRGGLETVVVAANTKHTTTIRIPIGTQFSGVVLGQAGKPIPFAELVVTDSGNSAQAQAAGHADAKGRFVLRDVHAQHGVAARAPNYAPSRSQTFFLSRPGEKRRVVFRLAPGGSLRGRVLDHLGKPLQGAQVRVVSTNQAPRVRTNTDADGRFEVSGVWLGSVGVWVRARGHAPQSVNVVVGEEVVAVVDVRLRRGATVHGVVRLASGDPVKGANVMTGRYGAFLGGQTRTAADGSYALPDLTPGDAKMVAHGRYLGTRRETLALVSGRRAEWNPVIESGRTVTGVLLDQDGKPVAGHIVNARRVGEDRMTSKAYRGQGRSNSEGRFTIVRCPDAELLLLIQGRDGAPLVAMLKVWPDRGDLRVTLRPSHEVTGTLQFRVEDYRGNPIVTTLQANGGPFGFLSPQRSKSNGALLKKGIWPGRYTLSIDSGDTGRIDLGEKMIVGGKKLSLGVIRLPQPGKLTLEYAGAKADWSGVQIKVECVRPWHEQKIEASELPRTLSLLPGRYRVTVTKAGLGRSGPVVEITSGQTVRMPLTLARVPTGEAARAAARARATAMAPRVSQSVRFVLPLNDGRKTVPTIEYVITSAGRPVVGPQATLLAGSGALELSLPAGGYKLHAITADGLFGDASFTVKADVGPVENPVQRVQLRPSWAAEGAAVVFKAILPKGTRLATVRFYLGYSAINLGGTFGSWVVKRDAKGGYRVGGLLKPGNYRVAALGPNQKVLGMMNFTVKAGESATVSVAMTIRPGR